MYNNLKLDNLLNFSDQVILTCLDYITSISSSKKHKDK